MDDLVLELAGLLGEANVLASVQDQALSERLDLLDPAGLLNPASFCPASFCLLPPPTEDDHGSAR